MLGPTSLSRFPEFWSNTVRIIAAAVGLAAALEFAAVPVTLQVDGAERSMVTRVGTVGALLAEAMVDVERGDLVSPPPSSHLRRGETVVVERARLVRINVEGDVRSIRTHAITPLGMLHAAGVSVDHDDRVAVGGQGWPADRPLWTTSAAGKTEQGNDAERSLVASSRAVAADRSRHGTGVATLADAFEVVPKTRRSENQSPSDFIDGTDSEVIVHIDILRPAPITVVEDGIPIAIMLTGRTVGESLAAAGLHLWNEDVLFPSSETLLSRTSRVSIQRAIPFTVSSDGENRSVRAVADTVSEALAIAGETLVGRDYSIPPSDTALRSGIEVQVVRVVEDFLVQQVDVPFGTETEADWGLPLDEKRVLREGEPGSKTQRIRIVYEDGEEISRDLIEEMLDREPVAQRIAYGTRIDWNTVQTEAGPKRYWRKLRVYATSYSASRAGTAPSAPWYGLTRLGWPMRKGIIAVDPRIIPLRTEMYVPEYGLGVAGDTGGGLKQYHIDLGYDDDNYQSWHWWVDAYLLEPLPPEGSIPWILP